MNIKRPPEGIEMFTKTTTDKGTAINFDHTDKGARS